MYERFAYIGSCMVVSTIAALLFYFLVLGQGYSKTDTIIGSIWTFVLAMILSSPIIIPIIRKKLRH